MNNNRKTTEKNTVIAIVVMLSILIIGSVILNKLKEPQIIGGSDSQKTTEGQNENPGPLVDGTYTAESPEPSNGFTDIVTMEVSNGNIVSLTYDAVSEDGESKSYLSSIGEYTMVEGNPTWAEQAQLLAEHVIENQSTNSLAMDEDGYTDAVSGVSINVGEFVNLTRDCLEQAGK